MRKLNNPIYVTQPSLPNLSEYKLALDKIWESKILTNNGFVHHQFEEELASYLGVPYISLFNNGTIALLTALQALEIKGEVITTPYSFIATANSILWNNLTPVFCDVDPVYGNIDASKIEALITNNTSAIMPVHVYGHPCNVHQIEAISKKHQLKVIYDAAHAFDVKIDNEPLLNYGDLSILSFHATKAFNTIEGGAIVAHTPEMKEKIDQLKNFGITSETTVVLPGINGKMNELTAAYGLLQLKNIQQQIAQRKIISNFYSNRLKNIKGIRLIVPQSNVVYNYSYFPIFINEIPFGITRDELYEKLKTVNIYARRYFYPLISNFPTYTHYPSAKESNLSNANFIANQVLCLPLYANLSQEIAEYIVNQIQSFSKC